MSKPGATTAYEHFVHLITTTDKELHQSAYAYLRTNWKASYRGIVIELSYLTPQASVETNLLDILRKKTGRSFGKDYNLWYEWLWGQEEDIAPFYHQLKALVHRSIDPRFTEYFLERQKGALIRFDEIRWGCVIQDGIPPLRNPKMVNSDQAVYLDDTNEVFGIAINGDYRAYPKRILAWHEMFTDRVGGKTVAGVYCTLCGTVILYETEVNGTFYELGTSGFLYRSNKLMYDKRTQSLWSTFEGKPVVGPLVDRGISLPYLSTVTTTWGEWKRLHPETTVLDINTGFHRDYSEGAAYKAYFATDELMFNVPKVDTSLKNKQSVLAIKLPEKSKESIAISVDFLKKNPIYHGSLAGSDFVVLTDNTGANRTYFTNGVTFKAYREEDGIVIDGEGSKWKVAENGLLHDGQLLERLHTFNAFWFGWKAVNPSTKLIK